MIMGIVPLAIHTAIMAPITMSTTLGSKDATAISQAMSCNSPYLYPRRISSGTTTIQESKNISSSGASKKIRPNATNPNTHPVTSAAYPIDTGYLKFFDRS